MIHRSIFLLNLSRIKQIAKERICFFYYTYSYLLKQLTEKCNQVWTQIKIITQKLLFKRKADCIFIRQGLSTNTEYTKCILWPQICIPFFLAFFFLFFFNTCSQKQLEYGKQLKGVKMFRYTDYKTIFLGKSQVLIHESNGSFLKKFFRSL